MWPGRVCRGVEFEFNANRPYSAFTVCQTLSAALYERSLISFHNNPEADGYHVHFTENNGGTERVSKFPKVTQLALRVKQAGKSKSLKIEQDLMQGWRRGNSLKKQLGQRTGGGEEGLES